MRDAMIVEVFTPKLKNRIRPPPSERNRTQDVPDRFKLRAQIHVTSLRKAFPCNLIERVIGDLVVKTRIGSNQISTTTRRQTTQNTFQPPLQQHTT